MTNPALNTPDSELIELAETPCGSLAQTNITGDLRKLHCPACGSEQSLDSETPACEHLAYVWMQEAEFVYLRPDLHKFEAKIAEAQEEDTFCDQVNLLHGLAQEEGLIGFDLSLESDACGPVSTRVAVGYNLNPKEN